MKEIPISKAQEGQRLDRFLAKCLPLASGGFLHKMLRKKNIKLNGQKAEGNEKLKNGDSIQIFFSDETFDKFRGNGEKDSMEASHSQNESGGRFSGKERSLSQKQKTAKNSLSKEEQALRKEVKLLYHDEDIVILHKPAGMLSQKSTREDDSINDYLLDLCKKKNWIDEETLQYFRPSIANRLDRNTSGIVLCGISTKGLQLLAQTLKDRTISKYYLALVKGQVRKGAHLKGYLNKDHEKNLVTFSEKPGEDAMPIETEYEVMYIGERATLLRIRLITGKSHQIRAHLASQGCPIIGDYKYGDRSINQLLKKELGISYQMLHSCQIDFGRHLNGKIIRDDIPKDFARAMDFFDIEYSMRGN